MLVEVSILIDAPRDDVFAILSDYGSEVRRRINPALLTTQDEFRAAIFHRLLDEMDLTGPRFAINPPRPVLELIAILGPVDVERPDFQESARQLLQRPA